MGTRVWIRRAYDEPTRNDGHRVLIDGLWPRGVSKEEARVDEWMRDIAPSSALRKWFGHDPVRWEEFRERYRSELEEHPELVDRLVGRARHGRITLVFGARDVEHSNARVVQQLVEERLMEEGT